MSTRLSRTARAGGTKSRAPATAPSDHPGDGGWAPLTRRPEVPLADLPSRGLHAALACARGAGGGPACASRRRGTVARGRVDPIPPHDVHAGRRDVLPSLRGSLGRGRRGSQHSRRAQSRARRPRYRRVPIRAPARKMSTRAGRRRGAVTGPPQRVIRVATLYFVTDVRRPGVSPAGIAFSTSSPRL